MNAWRALRAAAELQAARPPQHVALGVSFRDMDPRIGALAGIVTILCATDESDVEYYKVYFVSAKGFPIATLGQIEKSRGAKSRGQLLLNLSRPLGLPAFATRIVVVTGGSSGEGSAVLAPDLVANPEPPSQLLLDIGRPAGPPLGLDWSGDEDPRAGHIAGYLWVARATDEQTVTEYHVYWRGRSRGSMLAAVQAIGFKAPSCTGSSCHRLSPRFAGAKVAKVQKVQSGEQATGTKHRGFAAEAFTLKRAEGQLEKVSIAAPQDNDDDEEEVGRRGPILRLERMNYSDNEMATVSFTGPARIRILRFDTEHDFDTLSIGDVILSGRIDDLPMTLLLPPGDTLLAWVSDGSDSGGSWSLELQQDEARAAVRLPMGTEALAAGAEVFASYSGAELDDASAPSVLMTDFDASRDAPSGAFKPRSLRVSLQRDKSRIAGSGELKSSAALRVAEALHVQAVEFYRIDFADVDGTPLHDGSGWQFAAPAGPACNKSGDCHAASRWIAVVLTPQDLPLTATQLVSRAGNRHGLSPVGSQVPLVSQAPDLRNETRHHSAGMSGSG